MKVSNKELFHIHSIDSYDDIWQVGNIINIDNDFISNRFLFMNERFKLLSNYFKTNDVEELIKKIEYLIAEFMFLSDEEQKMHEDTIEVLRDYLKFLHTYKFELGLETARKKIDESLPSRFHSIWLTNDTDLNYWKSKFDYNDIVFKLSLDGTLFKTSDNFFPSQLLPLKEIIEEAYNYWKPNNQETIVHEYLFQGKATIIKKL